MKNVFIIISTFILSSCTILDYQREMKTFSDYMAGIVFNYGYITDRTINMLVEADAALYGPLDQAEYKKIEENVWLTPGRDTLWTDGHSFMKTGAEWGLSCHRNGSPNKGRYTFTRSSEGWNGLYQETMSNEGVWKNFINSFSCTMDMTVEFLEGKLIIHLEGERIEDEYSSVFYTTEGIISSAGRIHVETFKDGKLLDAGTVSFDEGYKITDIQISE